MSDSFLPASSQIDTPYFESPQDGIIALAYLMALIDGEIDDEEYAAIRCILEYSPALEGYDITRCEQVGENVVRWMESNMHRMREAAQEMAEAIAKVLTPPERETALALACDVAAANHEFHEAERELTRITREALGISKLVAQALLYASQARARTVGR